MTPPVIEQKTRMKIVITGVVFLTVDNMDATLP